MSKINILVVLVLLLMPSMMEYSSIPDRKIYKTANNTIDFTHRNITYIPLDEIYQLYATVLNFADNYLKFSSDDVLQLSRYPYRLAVLEILLSNNCIENMPYLCKALPNLMIIDLRYNNIRSLRKEDLLCFKNLKTVLLGNNPLKDTEFKILKTELSHINFESPKPSNNNNRVLSVKRCDIINESTSNDTVSTRTLVEDDVTTSNTKEESIKTIETTNSATEETTTTTKSDVFLSSDSSKTTEENDLVSTATPVQDDDTASNTKEESTKTIETTNSATEETTTTTKSDVFLSSDSSKTTEENDLVSTATPVQDDDTASNTKEESAKITKSTKSAGEETSTTKSDSHSTTLANQIHKENDNIWLKIIFIPLGGVGFGCLLIYIILCYHQKGKESKKKLEETENEEYLTSVEQLLSSNSIK